MLNINNNNISWMHQVFPLKIQVLQAKCYSLASSSTCHHSPILPFQSSHPLRFCLFFALVRSAFLSVCTLSKSCAHHFHIILYGGSTHTHTHSRSGARVHAHVRKKRQRRNTLSLYNSYFSQQEAYAFYVENTINELNMLRICLSRDFQLLYCAKFGFLQCSRFFFHFFPVHTHHIHHTFYTFL